MTIDIPVSLSETTAEARLIQEKRWWSHPTLWQDARRRDAYRSAFLELALQPTTGSDPFRDARAVATALSQASGDAEKLGKTLTLVTDAMYAGHGLLPGGVGYGSGGTFWRDLLNSIRRDARAWQAFERSPAFRNTMAVLSVAQVTEAAFDLVAGAASMAALNHDAAEARLMALRRSLQSVERLQGQRLDSALWAGLDDARTDLAVLQDQGFGGAFVVNLDQNKAHLVAGLPGLAIGLQTAGAAVLHTRSALADPRLIPFLVEWQEVQAISGEEREIHLAACMATLHRLLTAGRSADPVVEQAICYTQAALFTHMHHAFTSSWTVGFKRLLNRSLREWGDHYGELAQASQRDLLPPPVPAELLSLGAGWSAPAVGDTPLAAGRAVMFILDNSGSMSNAVSGSGTRRIDAAREALHRILDEGRALDIAWSLVAVNGRPDRSLVDFTTDIEQVVRAADALEPVGQTPLAETLADALNAADAHCPSSVCQMVLLSDGLADDMDGARDAALEIKRRNDRLFQHLNPLPGGPMHGLARLPGPRELLVEAARILVAPAGAQAAAPEIGVVFSVVAFDTDDAVQTALASLADAAGGRFYAAADAPSLLAGLRTAVFRENQLSTPTGEVVVPWPVAQRSAVMPGLVRAPGARGPGAIERTAAALLGALLTACFWLARERYGFLGGGLDGHLERVSSAAAGSKPQGVRVTGTRFRIGRRAGLELTIDHQDVAPVHAVIRRVGGRPQVESSVPSHPILVNGRTAQRSDLRDGDTLSIGPVMLRYRRGIRVWGASGCV